MDFGGFCDLGNSFNGDGGFVREMEELEVSGKGLFVCYCSL